jgi:hypothetical protein
MENKLYEKWLKELEQELSLLDESEPSPLERLRNALPLISKVTNEIKDAVLKEGFYNQADEIYFFKKIKPQLYALQLWEMAFYDISTRTPAGTKEMVKAYYEQELIQVFRLLNTNSFHYQYFKTGASELDHVCFLRDAKESEIPVLEFIDPYPGFSTALDYTVAKFMAYERLRDYLLDLLTNLYGENKLATGADEMPLVKWTGDTINLVELGYGVWLTGQVNNGDAAVADIIEALECAFQISVGRAYRRWQSIGQRKRVSPVKYINQMRDAIKKRLEEGNRLDKR